MLVLSRCLDEAIQLPGLGEIRVLKIEDGKVRLGIDLPEVIRIFRQEVWADIQAECLANPELAETWRRHLELWPELLAQLEAQRVPRRAGVPRLTPSKR